MSRRPYASWIMLAVAVIVALAALPSAATARPLSAGAAVSGHLGPLPKGQAPMQVIDAQTDPQQAGEALNEGCANLQNCSWDPTSKVTDGWSAPAIFGDVLYNCSPDYDNSAETAVGVSDAREESTSISESVSVEIGLGFLGFEKNTAEFEAFSKQSESFSTEVSITSAVPVPGMWKGYTTTSVLSANVTGDAYITAGINQLIEVKDMDLNFPGYAPSGTPATAAVAYIGNKSPMTAAEISTYCGAISGLSAAKRVSAPKRFTVTLCAQDGTCGSRQLTGAQLPHIASADVTLRARGDTYASGTDRDGGIRLTAKRVLKPDSYTLVIRQQPQATGPGQRPPTAVDTTIPVTLG